MRLEFECLHRCKMLIGGDDIRNDVITLGTCFSMFFHICARFRFALLGKSNSSVDCAPKGNWRWNSNFRDVVASSPSFSLPAARVSRRACSQDNAAINACFEERIVGQIGKCPVKPLGYLNFTKVIFRPIKRLKLIGS